MSGPATKPCIYVKSNNEFIFLETYSGYWNFLPDSEGERYLLSHSSSDADLGSAAIAAISASRQIDPKNDPNFFDIAGRVVPKYKDWVSEMMERFGYKTKRAMFKDMKSCSVELVGGAYVMQPSHHEKLEAWSGEGLTENDYVLLPADSSSERVGAALRLTLARCT
ncbi:contact-dependent growth inhibition system immunity protein [Achromobacter insuavis]|uniref:contact-dependent growth inhibition system immunity protein n=1 Tax=Achromobacter insuavis TaxID=1287735 RepID=UPI0015D3BA60|nr:contact-dependent growth inhibition system immunity protein [Achromobacter insuavis]